MQRALTGPPSGAPSTREAGTLRHGLRCDCNGRESVTEVPLPSIPAISALPPRSNARSLIPTTPRERALPSTRRNVYLLDEPTTGLHFDDVHKLLDVLNRLADLGNTVIVVEHNLDVIKTAHWVIDLGPEAGPAGGLIVAQGTPEEVAAKP